MYVLILESSTVSAKAMLYNTVEKTFITRAKEYKNSEIGLQDANHVFETTAALGRALCHNKKISAIALVSTWHNIMLCDMDMTPQSPVYQWTYTGASDLCKELRKNKSYTKNYYKKTGCMVNITYAFFNLKLLQQQGRDLKNYKIVGQGTYNTHKLTGKCVVTDVTVSGAGMLNIHTRNYDDDLMAELDITKENLATLISYENTYPLTKEGADILGLTPGIPVIPAMPDGAMNQVGSGALIDGVMTFSIGTSGAMRLSTPTPVIPQNPSTWCYLSPTAWISGAATAGCCNCIDWYKNKFFGPNISYTQAESGYTKDTAPPIFLPFLFGERCPGWQDNRLGGFFDVKPQHTIYDFYHAVQEGVLFNLYQCYEILTKVSGIPHKIKLSGGILNSKKWIGMCADIFGMPMELENIGHASLMGGVVLAMRHLDIINDLRKFEVLNTEVVMPNTKNLNMYKARYQRYLQWYGS